MKRKASISSTVPSFMIRLPSTNKHGMS
jgi:hypothetical protein